MIYALYNVFHTSVFCVPERSTCLEGQWSTVVMNKNWGLSPFVITQWLCAETATLSEMPFVTFEMESLVTPPGAEKNLVGITQHLLGTWFALKKPPLLLYHRHWAIYRCIPSAWYKGQPRRSSLWGQLSLSASLRSLKGNLARNVYWK